MKLNVQKMLLSAVAMLLTSSLCAQEISVDYKKFPDANPMAKGPTKSQEGQNSNNGALRSSIYGQSRPDHVNNALRKFFPPVFNQSGGSCGSAQAVAYCMTYDMNAYRNTDASYPENQLPTHFTWLHTYAGIDKYPIMNMHGVPTVVDYGGRTYSETFGNQDTSNPDYGYMQGYDKWYRAMFNRTVGGDTFCDANQMTELGREQLKQWLWNHWGDESFWGGGVSGIGVASGGDWGYIPNTATNREIGVAGLRCVASWGKTYDHALTVVGYDDRIEFDLDSNGVFGEEGKDEKGAWIICNSWGSGWCNKGFIYCPYKFSVAIGTSTLSMNSGHYTWRKDYEPKRVFKIKMEYSHRSELSIAAGIAQDTSATSPEKSETMPFFNYAGDGTKSNPAPQVPMLGKWRGKMNTEPMEFGYDVTDLSASCDLSKPQKYFLVISSRYGAIGSGNILSLSLMDYEIEKDGLEMPARIDSVEILNNGQQTLVWLTVPGRQTYAPLNATLSANRLSWDAPKTSSYPISRYYIYKGSQKIAEVPEISHSFTVDDELATYYIATAYEYKDQILLSPKSEPARNSQIHKSEQNSTLILENASILLPSAFKEAQKQATIEFLFKPSRIASNIHQIGQKWGTFLFNVTNTGQIQCGWDANNCVKTATNTLKANNWYHIALVVDKDLITVYVNGMKKGSVTSTSFNGIPALESFYIGTPSGLIDGEIDEFRIWTTARSQKEIFSNKGLEIANPAAQTDLLAYFPMESFERDGALYLKDLASSEDAMLSSATPAQDQTVLTGTTAALTPSISLPSEELYAGQPIQLRSTSLVSTQGWNWSAPTAQSTLSTVVNPYFTFAEPGEHTITLSVRDVTGQITSASQTITVLSPQAPKADFEIAQTTLNEGELFSLANMSVGANCQSTWSTPGANQETIHAVNATVSYSQTGTFPITLTVSNAGGQDQITKYVTVLHSSPAVAFSVDPAFLALGETTYLVDQSRHNPDAWKWTISNGVHTTVFEGQNTSFTPKHPGNYTVQLEATNDVGTSTYAEPHRLVVVNADSRNGLNFTGSEQCVSTKDLFDEGTRAFTIEWWMNPTTPMGALNFSTQNDQFKTETSIDGNMKVYAVDKNVESGDGFVIAGEWHHYAITFTFGTVKFYRDGVLITSPSSRITTTTTAWGKLLLSASEDHFKGQIDELRIWSKCLSLANLKSYINAPLEDVESLNQNSGLVAYYDFNQTGGSVVDRTSNKIDLERQGFGPDGDAWGLSRGVFTLDFDTSSPEIETLDADGLTHIYESVKAGKQSKYSGLKGAIRLAIQEQEQIKIFTLDGQCVLNDIVEGVHILPFDKGIYLVNGVKVRVE